MKRIGILNVNIDNIEVIGFGVVTGTKVILDDDLGVDLTVTIVKLDNGSEVIVRDSIMGAEDIINKEIDIYRGKGYVININK